VEGRIKGSTKVVQWLKKIRKTYLTEKESGERKTKDVGEDLMFAAEVSVV